MISRPILNFLKVCFWISILLFIIQLFQSFQQVYFIMVGIKYEPNIFIKIVSIILTFTMLIIFVYSLYFFIKYDKYSKSGVYFFFFHVIYAFIYFYRVIWKRRRELVNSFKSEPVLGSTIMLETEEFEELEIDEEKEKV